MANDMRYLSAEEEAKLLKPIDEYVGKIQAQIDALRVDGSDKVQALKTHISLTKEDKNYTKEEQNAIIRKDQELLVKAREVETANKDKVSKLIADAESYLKTHLRKIITIRLQQVVQLKRKLRMQNMKRFAQISKQSTSAQFPA